MQKIEKFLMVLFKQNPRLLPSSFLFIVGILFKSLNFNFFYIFFVASILTCGYNLILSGIHGALAGKFSEKFLISLSVLASIALQENLEAFLVLIFYEIGEAMEHIASTESKNNINFLACILPNMTHVIFDGKERKVSPSTLREGDICKVYPFERIPCDGIVIDGNSFIDTSSITGESIPISAFKGTSVYAGSMNTSGTIFVRTKTPLKNSSIGKLLKIVENNSKNKSKYENFLAKFSQKYTLIVILLSLLLFIINFLLKVDTFTNILKRSLCFLVASCPCSMIISVPLAFFYGIGKSAKERVLIKGGKYIENLAKVNKIFFDKTGTLTKNYLIIDRIYTFDNLSEEKILHICAHVEFNSSHPIAKAIKKRLELKETCATDISEFPGLGVKASFSGKEIICGNSKLLSKHNINLPKTDNNISLFLAINRKLVGGIAFKDEIRKESVKLIYELNKLNIKSAILSGDSEKNVKKVASDLRISEFYANLMPEDKLKILNSSKTNGVITAFIGDGINDTPALIAANCGIAMGLGSEIAIETANVILADNNIFLLKKALDISKRVINTVTFNIIFAISIKIFVLLISSLFTVPMWLAAFADVGVTLISILNAINLKIK